MLGDWYIEMQAEARAVLIAAVAASPDLPRPTFAWEGERFTPTADPFITETFRPDTTRQASVGRASGTIEHRATVALVLQYPPGEGTNTARRMATLIMDAFRPGRRLERAGCAAWVEKVDPRPSYQDVDRLTLPVNIGLIGHTNL